MFLTIMTDEIGLDITEAAPILKEWGFEYVDLRSRLGLKSIDTLNKQELADVKKILDNHGLKVGCLQSSLAKVHLPEKDRYEKELAKIEVLKQAMDVLDCRTIRGFNFWQPRGEDKGTLMVQPDRFQRMLSMCGPIIEAFGKEGIRYGIENCGQTPEEVHAVLDAVNIPEWGIAFDVFNSYASNGLADEESYLVKNIERVVNIHVKARSMFPELGEKHLVPWDRVLAGVAATDRSVPITIETHNPKKSGYSKFDLSRRMTDRLRQLWPSAAPTDIRSAVKKKQAIKIDRSYLDNPVGFAVVGLGMGHNRAGMISETPGAKLIGVCDLVEERAKRTGEAYGVPYTTDVAPWLKDRAVEAVFVLTETGNHAEVALQALEAEKHVMTTKPMEANLAACRRMITKAREKGRLLAVDFGRRYAPEVQKVKSALSRGFLGRPLSATVQVKILRTDEYYAVNNGWHGTWALDGGGVFSNQVIHEIDTLIYWFGLPAKVKADTWTLNHDIEAEDLGTAVWEYTDGLIVNLYATTGFPYSTWYDRTEIHGTEGAYLGCRGCPKTEDTELWYDGKEWQKDKHFPYDLKWVNSVDNFADAVRAGAPLLCDGTDGTRSRLVLDMMYVSAREGGIWKEIAG